MELLLAVVIGLLYAGGLYLMMRRDLVKLIVGLALIELPIEYLLLGRVPLELLLSDDEARGSNRCQGEAGATEGIGPMPTSCRIVAGAMGGCRTG